MRDLDLEEKILASENIDIPELEAYIQTVVYKALAIVERLENKGKICGNGHHIRQRLAKNSADYVLGTVKS